MKLVIVESPTKSTTIQRYLGEDYIVFASCGHVRDLATSGKGGLGVDVDNDFAPTYIVPKSKESIVKELKAKKKLCDEVILATDPDREGEAIAWHLAEVLKLDIEKTKRLEFHEITRESITNAIENPRTIDTNLVSSQEARRIIDRIIGFKLSTLIAKKINSKSAGRVQSSALKLVYELDKKIAEFVPEEYWNIIAEAKLGDKNIKLSFIGKDGKNQDIHNKEECDAILNSLEKTLKVISVKKTYRTKEPKAPFITSTLQQEAFARLKFKTKKTTSLAQKLYEGIDVGGEHMGLITYIRTEDTRLSSTFVNRAVNFISSSIGEEYLDQAKVKKALKESGNSALPHEAIRPASNHRTPESVKQYLTPDMFDLYKMIYNRALAALMKPRKDEVLSVILQSGEYQFKMEFTRTIFQGYETIYKDIDDEEKIYKSLPDIKEGETLEFTSLTGEQKFTQPPSHFSEAKLVRKMEEEGIGRPSTYASTIEIIAKRGYVNDTGGILDTTPQGVKTVKVLDKFFPEIIDVKYTANMEAKLDKVESGKISRSEVLNEFYDDFIKVFTSAQELMYKDEPVTTGEICPECGKPLVYKEGKNGSFIGCLGFPNCKYIQQEVKPVTILEETCPKCGKPLLIREIKVKGKPRTITACSGFPECKYIKKEDNNSTSGESKNLCPECGSPLVKKKGAYGRFYGCSNYPQCNYMRKISKK